MKANQVFVGVNGAALELGNGRRAVAVFPARKGEAYSHALLESGSLVRLKGSRINGVGVARYLSSNGFELALPGNKLADRLADEVDAIDGVELVQEATNKKAVELQSKFAGKTCTFVPFDETKSSAEVSVKAPEGFISISADLVEGFCAGNVQIEYVASSNCGFSVALSAGWLVEPEHELHLPRNSEYGGPVERAVFIMCNSGMGSLVGSQNLAMSDDPDYPRGKLEMVLDNGDFLIVAINGGDEPEVSYIRGGEVIYSRTGMYGTRLHDAVGAVAAVFVRVMELDLQKVKRSRKKAA